VRERQGGGERLEVQEEVEEKKETETEEEEEEEVEDGEEQEQEEEEEEDEKEEEGEKEGEGEKQEEGEQKEEEAREDEDEEEEDIVCIQGEESIRCHMLKWGGRAVYGVLERQRGMEEETPPLSVPLSPPFPLPIHVRSTCLWRRSRLQIQKSFLARDTIYY